MPNKPPGGRKMPLDAAAIARAVEAQLPGYRVAKSRGPTVDTDAAGRDNITEGASLEALRRKFLGGVPEDDKFGFVDSNVRDSITRDEPVQTVMVEPVDGGPAKTADVLPDGTVRIVQG